MDAAFETAAKPRPQTCLGLKLKPLTLGHLFLLRACDVAYLTGDTPTAEDLITAAFICSDTPERSERNLNAWWSPFVLRLWGFTCRKLNLAIEFQRFQKYFDSGMAAPSTVHPIIGGGMEIGSPIEWRLLVMLTQDFDYSEAQAMATTVVKANCLWATHAERQGKINLVTDRHRSFLEFARMMDAQKFGGRN